VIAGYILLGIVAAIFASVVSIMSGFSFGLTCAVYTLMGFAVVVVLVTIHVVVNGIISFASKRLRPDRQSAGAASTSEPESRSLSAPAVTGMRLLAVDDDPFILNLVEMISINAGLPSIVKAQSGEQALKLLNDPKLTFDYLLFDVRMPGLDGVDLCYRVRQIPRYRLTPITMLTGMRDTENMSAAFQAGANDYATKPFDVDKLGLRLRLAQNAMQAKRLTNLPSERAVDAPSHPIAAGNYDRIESFWRSKRNPVIDRKDLTTYLSQLPQKDIGSIQVFAVVVDQGGVGQGDETSQLHAERRSRVTTAITEAFGSSLVVMAYSGQTDVLVVTQPASMLCGITLEADIKARLQSDAITLAKTNGAAPIVSVGGPVQLTGAKQQRAMFATDRALMLAEDRIADKLGKSLTALRKA
jgi:DNA-binding response OmpR family regulator